MPRLVLLCALLLALPLGRANATTVVAVREADLVAHAVAIVVGEVTAIEGVKAQDGQIFTDVTIAVDEVVHGDVPPGDLTLRQVGGVVGDSSAWVDGSPEFVRGERVLLFLREGRDGTLRVAHLYQGKFTLMADTATGEEWAVRETPHGVLVLPSGAAAAMHVRHLGDFKKEIRRILRQLRVARRTGLMTAPMLPVGATTATAQAFTLLGSSRWFEPDAGLGVRMMINAAGQPGAPGLGFDAIRAALAAWSNVPGSSFRFEDGGFTSAEGFRNDGVSAISFGDPLGQIDPPIGCSGTVAVGGYSRASAESRVVSGQAFTRILEGDVVVADGWAGCGFYENPVNFAEVMTHELGHALGLGHSSDGTATMAPIAHWDGRGASLRADDMAALRYVYPGTPPPTPLTLAVANPADGATVRGTATVTLQAAGGTGLVYTATVDGATIYTGSNPTFGWDTTVFANGSRRLAATVRDATGRSASAAISVTVGNPTPPAITLAFGGLARDRVGRGTSALAADGLLDGVFTVRLGAGSGARTVTGLRLTSSAGGTWDTEPATIFWALGVAADLDAPLVNTGGGAVALALGDGGSFAIFGADVTPTLFAPGNTFTLTATFADGSSAVAATTVVVTAGPALTMSYDGLAHDRVGRGATAIGGDGLPDGVFTVRLAAGSGPRTITGLQLRSSSGGTWDTSPASIYWALGVAASADAALVNDATSAAILTVADGGSFAVFGSDSTPTLFAPGTTFTLTATFADGSTSTTSVTVGASTSPLTISYGGKLHDRVGQGNGTLLADGFNDGVFTVRLRAGTGARTVRSVELRSAGNGGVWDTTATSIYWTLGVAGAVDAPLANAVGDTVSLAVADGGSFTLFASDVPSGTLFAPGTIVTATVSFTDGTTATATTALD